ncbi:MAG: ComF family protein [Methylococcales bacterium]|nr:ComF family protein [Methylococcales bacterium]
MSRTVAFNGKYGPLVNYARKILNRSSMCILCDDDGIEGKDICKFCFQQLLRNKQSCYQCGYPLKSKRLSPLCGTCLSNPPDFNTTHAPFIYQGAIGYLITQLKFNQTYKNARLLGQIFADSLTKTSLPQCIIPVPLHKKRYRQRGFNQSLEIAKTVGKQLHIPIESKLCIRHRNTPHQIGLPKHKRHENVKNAFSLVKQINYTHIAILDDVMTTGSTLREITRIFKKAGVSTIELWVCARA